MAPKWKESARLVEPMLSRTLLRTVAGSIPAGRLGMKAPRLEAPCRPLNKKRGPGDGG